jgi:catechol 2,3-dioxygenase-like lactoylglutathione lyase family enzyme
MHVAFVVYPVTNIDRSRAFYRDVLGFDEGESLNESYYEFDLAGVGFAINSVGAEHGTPPGSAFSLAIEVADLTALKAKLEKSGVQLQSFESPRCDAVFVADPDGNRVAFHHLKNASLRNP